MAHKQGDPRQQNGRAGQAGCHDGGEQLRERQVEGGCVASLVKTRPGASDGVWDLTGQGQGPHLRSPGYATGAAAKRWRRLRHCPAQTCAGRASFDDGRQGLLSKLNSLSTS